MQSNNWLCSLCDGLQHVGGGVVVTIPDQVDEVSALRTEPTMICPIESYR